LETSAEGTLVDRHDFQAAIINKFFVGAAFREEDEINIQGQASILCKLFEECLRGRPFWEDLGRFQLKEND
jgi:hypothetical protein